MNGSHAPARGGRPGSLGIAPGTLDLRLIFFFLGVMLVALALLMLLPATADLVVGHPDWRAFFTAAVATLFVGVSLALMNRQTARLALTARQAFLLTTLVWLAAAAFGALPFMLSALGLSVTDAFFEAMSGITTTGSTVIVGLDALPPGLLLWRALLQWLGGVGFIVLALAALPALGVGGMQLFQTESSDRSGKILPRANQIAGAIAATYAGLTALCAAAYGLAGMGAFDAVTHAMTTLSTGGYSTHDASIAFFDSPAIEGVATLFMVLGALPFVLYIRSVRGDGGALWRDTQVRWFLALLLAGVLAVAGWLFGVVGLFARDALRFAAFNVVSVVTTTGYASTNYEAWGAFGTVAFFLLMFAGGCTGSTAGGIKTFRYVVLYHAATAQLLRLGWPHAVAVPRFNRRPIPGTVMASVLAFVALFGLCTVALTLLLAALGLDHLTSLSGAATALTNVGPGLGPVIGPVGNFAPLPDGAKWLLAFGMLLGRLELFTVLVLFAPAFWRR